jgi:dynein heavy chain
VDVLGGTHLFSLRAFPPRCSSRCHDQVIFSQPDIQRQLPAEAAKFQRVDKHWKDLMRKSNKTPNVIQVISTPGLLELLVEDNKLLDQIQKSLEDYLVRRRLCFAAVS